MNDTIHTTFIGLRTLKPGDLVPGPAGKPEIVVLGVADDPRFMELTVGRVILHARLDRMGELLQLLTVGGPDSGNPLEFIVESMDDVAFHLHELAAEHYTLRGTE